MFKMIVNKKFAVSRQGFTLVELLVVIAIIGVLVALLLPAIQAAREAARRNACLSNFKQVGVAMHNFVAAKGHLPSGQNVWREGRFNCANPGNPTASLPDHIGWGWGTFILPYLEQQAIYDRMDFNQAWFATGDSFVAAATKLPVYLCPSDPSGSDLMDCCSPMMNGGNDDEDVAASNMAGVADSRNFQCGSGGSFARLDGDGVLYTKSDLPISHITDGTSNTLMIGEVLGIGPGTHQGFFWVSHGVLHTANGINTFLQYTTRLGTPPPRGVTHSFNEGGFSSFHPSGCHFVFADGSGHFLSDSIDALTLAALTTRAAEDMINGEY
jgi:prepilin-type N-terminal cleavage/methylation domain-containing protein